jgi:hypothetical protein
MDAGLNLGWHNVLDHAQSRIVPGAVPPGQVVAL